MKDSTILSWLADRLVHVYGEDPNVDFVHAVRRIAVTLAPKESDPLFVIRQARSEWMEGDISSYDFAYKVSDALDLQEKSPKE